MAAITKLSATQVILLLVLVRLNTAYTYLPSVTTPPANQDVWIAILLAAGYGFIVSGPLMYLANRFEHMTLLEYVEKIMGKFPGKLLGLLFAAQMAFSSLLQLPLLDNFLRSVVIPETPDYPLLLLTLSVCVYAVYKGLESLGRLAEVFAPPILVAIIVFTLLNIKKMEFEVLLPVLADSSFSQINIGALSLAGRFTEIVALAMLVPHISKKGEINRILTWYIAIFTFLFLMITISVQSVLGTELAIRSNFPYFLYTQTIKVYDVFERIESVSAVIWFFGTLLKCSLYLYLAAAGLAQVFNVKSYKVFIIPIALLEYIIVLKTPLIKFDVMSQILSWEVFPKINMIGLFGMPLLVLIVYFLRRKSLQH
jgi:spore germination protein KB